MRKTYDSHFDYCKDLRPEVRRLSIKRLVEKFDSEEKAKIHVDLIVDHVFEKAKEHQMWKNSKKDPIAWLTTCLKNAVVDLCRRSNNKFRQDALGTTDFVDTAKGEDEGVISSEHPGFIAAAKEHFLEQERRAGFKEVVKRLNHFLTKEEQLFLRYSHDGLPDTAICDHMSIKRTRLRKIRTSLEKKAEKLGLRELLFNIATVLSEYFDTLFLLQC